MPGGGLAERTNPVWTCLVQHGQVRRLQARHLCVCVLTRVSTDTYTHTDTCVSLCLCTHMCGFSPLSKDSWILAAAVPAQTQRGSGSEGQPRGAQTAVSHFPLLQSTLLPHHTQNRRFLLHRSGSVTRDKGAQLCVACPVKIRAPRHPESVPAPPRPGGAGSHSLFPTHLGCHPRTARRWNRGDPSPGARLPSRSVLSFGLTEMPLIYNIVPVSVPQSDSATHRHTFFFYILSHCGLSQEMGHSSRGLQQGLVVYSF